jgi:hypothetical protein
LDGSIGDTFVSVGTMKGVHTSVSPASLTVREALAQYTAILLLEELARLAWLKEDAEARIKIFRCSKGVRGTLCA